MIRPKPRAKSLYPQEGYGGLPQWSVAVTAQMHIPSTCRTLLDSRFQRLALQLISIKMSTRLLLDVLV